MSSMLDFKLLGPLRVRIGGKELEVGSPKHRVLLAALMLNAGRPVAMNDLIHAMWEGNAPDNPRRAIQLYVTRLRATFAGADAGDLIVTRPDAYQLDASPHEVDALQFDERLKLARQARGRADVETEIGLISDALEVWHGEPLADVPSEPLQRDIVPYYREQWLRAHERLIEIQLASKRHADAIESLTSLIAHFPLHEPLWAQLVRALNVSGRRTDALVAYHNVRHRLAEELGMEPGEELQAAHATVLLAQTASDSEGATALGLRVPRELPQSPTGFTGRLTELAQLDRLLEKMERSPLPGRAVLVTVAGTAGVGKSALTARWTRQVADHFPDGQVWINLRGFHPERALDPRSALIRLLRAMGAPGQQIPPEFDDQVSMYRTLIDGRRMLIVLDNAISPDQVRPLLPGAPHTYTIVTSRNQMPGLAIDGAKPLNLAPLAFGEARELLTSRLGIRPNEQQLLAIDEIVNRCARLPLALVVAAARALASSDVRLEAIAQRLAESTDSLDALATGDDHSDVRAVFSWSYDALKPFAASVFRLLGLHPGPDMALQSIASLTATPLSELKTVLTELCDAHLLAEPTADRYVPHDLLRAYARELAQKTDDSMTRESALNRVLDYYVQSARAALEKLHPRRMTGVTFDPPHDGTTPYEPSDQADALAWYENERRAIPCVIRQAIDAQNCATAWRLAALFSEYLNHRGMWHEMVALNLVALEAAEKSGDSLGQIFTCRALGGANGSLGRYEEAQRWAWHAVELSEQTGDVLSEALSRRLLTWLSERQGRHDMALRH